MFPVPASAWFLLSDIIAALQKCVANEVLKYICSQFRLSVIRDTNFRGLVFCGMLYCKHEENEDSDFVAQHICTTCLLYLLVSNLCMRQKTASCVFVANSSVCLYFSSLEKNRVWCIANYKQNYHEAIISLEYNTLATKLWYVTIYYVTWLCQVTQIIVSTYIVWCTYIYICFHWSFMNRWWCMIAPYICNRSTFSPQWHLRKSNQRYIQQLYANRICTNSSGTLHWRE